MLKAREMLFCSYQGGIIETIVFYLEAAWNRDRGHCKKFFTLFSLLKLALLYTCVKGPVKPIKRVKIAHSF